MACNNFKKLIIVFILLIINIVTEAKVVHIKIAEANDIGIKLIVFPFKHPHKNFSEVSSIVAHDLNYSGQFKANVLNNSDLEGDLPTSSKNIDFKFWRDLGAEYLLMTKLYPIRNATNLVVNVQLIDLYKPLEPLILNLEIDKDPKEDQRKLAHKISNIVFEKLTSIKGFFNTKIAYVRAERLGEKNPIFSLNIADFDGFNEHKLLEANYPIMSPNWSRDGKKICFVSFKNYRANISVADLEARRINTITHYPGINGAPAWSPDGTQLALVLSKDGSPKIYVLDLHKDTLQKITHGPSIDTEPCWDKDGNQIFFTSNRGGKPQIYKISLRTKEIERVTFKGDYNATPSLTPNNRHLVMLHCEQNCSRNDSSYNVAVLSLDTGKTKILSKMGMEDSPVIAPNGVTILYSTERSKNDTNRVLASISIDGNYSSYLSIPGSGSIKNPAWSPFLD